MEFIIREASKHVATTKLCLKNIESILQDFIVNHFEIGPLIQRKINLMVNFQRMKNKFRSSLCIKLQKYNNIELVDPNQKIINKTK